MAEINKLPFIGLKVVECAEYPSGEMLGQLIAEMGADVIKVEPPEGALSRRMGPYLDNEVDINNSINFWYYNTNKKSVILDLKDTGDRQKFDNLLHDTDIFISTWQPHELKAMNLDLDKLQEIYPRLIIVSSTPFGLTGPWADYLSSDLVALAAGGPLSNCGYDDHSLPPIRPGGNQSYHTATSHSYIGALLALVERDRSRPDCRRLDA